MDYQQKFIYYSNYGTDFELVGTLYVICRFNTTFGSVDCKEISFLWSVNEDGLLNCNFNWYICVWVMNGLEVSNDDPTMEMKFHKSWNGSYVNYKSFDMVK